MGDASCFSLLYSRLELLTV